MTKTVTADEFKGRLREREIKRVRDLKRRGLLKEIEVSESEKRLYIKGLMKERAKPREPRRPRRWSDGEKDG